MLVGIKRCGSEYNRGTGCGKTARPGLCGGCRVTDIPTTTIKELEQEAEKLNQEVIMLKVPHYIGKALTALHTLKGLISFGKRFGVIIWVIISSAPLSPIVLLLLFLFVVFMKKEFFRKRKILIIIAFALLFILSVLPAFAAEGKGNATIEDKLEEATNLRTLSGVDKAIYILKHKLSVEIPPINMPEEYAYLTPPRRRVKEDPLEYHYALGCAYLLKGQGGDATRKFQWIYKNVSSPQWYTPETRKRYGDVLLSIVRYFIKSGDINRASEALESGLPFISSVEDLLNLSKDLDKNGMGPSADKALKQAEKVAGTPEDRLEIVSFLLKKGKKEEAHKSLDDLIHSTEDLRTLYNVALFCIEQKQKLYPEAETALRRICALYPKEAEKKVVPFPSYLSSSIEPPPVTQGITLPVLYGIVSELNNKRDNAERAYKLAASDDLDQVINSGGTRMPDNLSSFFYLKRLWEKNGATDKSKKLTSFYKLAKKDYDEHYIQKLKDEHQELVNRYNELNSHIKELKGRIRHLKISALFRILRLIVCGVILLGMLVFSLYDAWRHTFYLGSSNAFAFLGRFIENLGWCACFTIIYIPVGIGCILIGQLMRILLGTREDIKVLRGATAETSPETGTASEQGARGDE